MRKTDILEVVARKLAPYMFLFGLYLVTFGDRSPGGGFQGGAVIASGVILIAMGQGADRAGRLFPVSVLQSVETLSFAAFLLVGIMGIVLGIGFLADGLPRGLIDFVFLLNVIIGFKVAAGVSVICLVLFRDGAS